MRPPLNAGENMHYSGIDVKTFFWASMRPPLNAGENLNEGSRAEIAPPTLSFNEAPAERGGKRSGRRRSGLGLNEASMRPPLNAGKTATTYRVFERFARKYCFNEAPAETRGKTTRPMLTCALRSSDPLQ